MRAFADRPDCRIVALVDRAVDRRTAFAQHYGAEAIYDDVEALLADQVPDIVSIILPVSESPRVVMACARAGVRVVSCEKPIAASLAEADETVRVCRECGTMLGCSTSYWDGRHLVRTARWLAEEQPLGAVTEAAIPSGILNEVSGGGCVSLSLLCLMTGMSVKWVEGWALPPATTYVWPPGTRACEIDSGVHGRVGLSGGVVCQIPGPAAHPLNLRCPLAITYENGQVSVVNYRDPVIIMGRGPAAAPYHAPFFEEPADVLVPPAVARLVHAFESGEPIVCSGENLSHALEVAIALKQSAHDGHRRVELPLADRSARIFPHAHRLHGGDAIGWANTHYEKPPDIEAP